MKKFGRLLSNGSFQERDAARVRREEGVEDVDAAIDDSPRYVQVAKFFFGKDTCCHESTRKTMWMTVDPSDNAIELTFFGVRVCVRVSECVCVCVSCV